MANIDDNDLLDLGFDLPPLPKLNLPGEDDLGALLNDSPSSVPSVPPMPAMNDELSGLTSSSKLHSIDDILSAPDSDIVVPPSEDMVRAAAFDALEKIQSVPPKPPMPLHDDDLPDLPRRSDTGYGYTADNSYGSGYSGSDDASEQAYQQYEYTEEPAQELPPTSSVPVSYDSRATGLTPASSMDYNIERKPMPIPVEEEEPEPGPALTGTSSIPFTSTNAGRADLTPAASMPDGIPPEKRTGLTPASSVPSSAGEYIPPSGSISVERKAAAIDDDLPDLPPLTPRKESAAAPTAAPMYKKPEPEPEPEYEIEEYDEDGDLDSIDTSKIVMSEMDSGIKHVSSAVKSSAKALKQQMLLDEMSMSGDGSPVLEDLSNEYTSVKEKISADDFFAKDKLNADERKALKDKLREEINKRPQGFNQRASAIMQNNLLEEKKMKIAKKGMFLTLLVMVLCLGNAAVTYFGIYPVMGDLYFYLAAATVVFSLLLMIKSKHMKVLSTIYFVADTIVLAGPGLIMHVLAQKETPDPNFNMTVVWFIVAMVLSGFSVFMLATNDLIHAYYTTKIKKR